MCSAAAAPETGSSSDEAMTAAAPSQTSGMASESQSDSSPAAISHESITPFALQSFCPAASSHASPRELPLQSAWSGLAIAGQLSPAMFA